MHDVETSQRFPGTGNACDEAGNFQMLALSTLDEFNQFIRREREIDCACV